VVNSKNAITVEDRITS